MRVHFLFHMELLFRNSYRGHHNSLQLTFVFHIDALLLCALCACVQCAASAIIALYYAESKNNNNQLFTCVQWKGEEKRNGQTMTDSFLRHLYKTSVPVCKLVHDTNSTTHWKRYLQLNNSFFSSSLSTRIVHFFSLLRIVQK